MTSNPEEKIFRFISKLRLRFVLVESFNGLIEIFAASAIVFFIAVLSVGNIDIAPIFLRNFFATILILSSAAIIARRLFLFLKNYSDWTFIRLVQNSNPCLKDNLQTAYSLILTMKKSENISVAMRALAEAHIFKTAAQLDSISYKSVIPFPTFKKILIRPSVISIFFVMVFGFFYPNKYKATWRFILAFDDFDFYKNAIVIPGDNQKEAALGSEILIGIALPREAILSSDYVGIAPIEPKLFISRKNTKTVFNLKGIPPVIWRATDPTALKSADHRATNGDYLMWSKKIAVDVFEDIRYYFSINNSRVGKEYQIKVVPPAVFSSFKIRYVYPPYTRMPPVLRENELNLECYPGTRVTIEAFTFSNEQFPDEAFLLLGGDKIPMSVNRRGKNPSSSVSFVASARANSYRFLTIKNGREFLSPEYPIEIKKDLPPEVEILSPNFDLDASIDDKIPIVWSAEDDFGVVKAELNIIISKDVGSKPSSSQVVRPLAFSSSDNAARRVLSDCAIDLAQFRFESDSTFALRYFISARDGAGNTGNSKTNSIFINSYESAHKEIMKKLSEISSETMDILSEQISAKRLLKDNTSHIDWEQLEGAQRKIADLARRVSKKFDSTLENMSKDPYFDGYIMQEYSAMSSNMKHLIDNQLSRALSSAKKRDVQSLELAQSEAISILENLAFLSSDVAKYQRVSDVENNMLKIEKRLDYALETLARSSDDKDIKGMLSDLEEISRLMSEIESVIKDMPQLLPEEFVNSESLKNADFPSARSALQALKDALLKGDINESRRLAEGLKNQLARLRDSLKNAAVNLAVRTSPSMMAQNFKRAAGQINSIVQKQKEILKKVSRLEDARLENVSRYQKKTLENLAARQKELNKIASDIVSSDGAGARRDGGILSSIPLMERILVEFSGGKVYNARKYLEDVINNFQAVKSRISQKDPVGEQVSSILRGEKEIFEILKSSVAPPFWGFQDKEKKELLAYARLQDNLRAELETVTREMKNFAKQTAMVTYETISKLKEASSEMILSSEELKNYNTFLSINHQRKVIELLENSSSEMDSAASGASGVSFGDRPVSSVMPSGGGYRTSAESGGGITGVLITEKVKLPTADDYKVPPAFREDIMKYLKERRPRDYHLEDVILRYYKRLVE